MFGCDHPWGKLRLKADGIQCEDCYEQWDGAGIEMIFFTASAAIKALHLRIEYMKEALSETLALWSCESCGRFYSKMARRQGFNYFSHHVCAECVPYWYFRECDRWPEPDRKYVRNHLARWLSENTFLTQRTLKIYKELEAEMINARSSRKVLCAVH